MKTTKVKTRKIININEARHVCHRGVRIGMETGLKPFSTTDNITQEDLGLLKIIKVNAIYLLDKYNNNEKEPYHE